MAGIIGRKTSAAILSNLRAAAPPLTRLLRLVTSRSHASTAFAAAQPQLDYDYDYSRQNESYKISRRDGPSSVPMVDPEGCVPLRGVQWVFIGSPAAKKHVFAEKLSKLLEVPHISMVSLVRQDLSPRSYLYKQIANAVNQGKVVPEDIIFGLLSNRLLEDGYYKGESGFILDGIPRTRIQAEILDKFVDIDLVVNFKCVEDSLSEHQGDGIFSHSQQSDHFGRPASASLGVASQKAQSKYPICNTESAWNGKSHFYANRMKPIEDYYKKQKKLIDFKVHSAPGETWQGLLAALQLKYINASHSRLTSGTSCL